MSEALDYIASIMPSLVNMARQHKLGTLAYLLDMARLEAGTQATDLGKAEDRRILTDLKAN